MLNNMRFSNDLRNLARYYPNEKFIAQDLLDIVNNKTNNVYQRLGKTDIEEPNIQVQSGDINRNKNKFLKKDTSKRSFKETPKDGYEWVQRISTIRSNLGLSHDDGTPDDLIKELNRFKTKGKSTLKAIRLTKADITYLLSVLKPDEDKKVVQPWSPDDDKFDGVEPKTDEPDTRE